MEPVTASAWDQVPGYDTDSDDDCPDMSSADRARLQRLIEAMGPAWRESDFIRFAPAPAPQSGIRTKDKREMAQARAALNGPTAPTFRIEHTDAPAVRETFLANGFMPAIDKEWLVQWSGPRVADAVYQGLHELQFVNHFPGSTELTRKDRLWAHFHEMAQMFGCDAFDFVPESYVLPDQVDEFLECYERTDFLWIVKPHASSRGRGIFLLRDLGELPLEEVSVVSRYVANPLLIQGLKFDLRVYVLVTSFDPLRAYVYREGLTRFASKPYSTAGPYLQDAYRHLTNYSINKSAPNFVENQVLDADNVGHKWSLSALNKHLRCSGVDVELMWSRIHDLIMKTLISVEPSISAKARQMTTNPSSCFELYGFDVLVDDQLKPWLLEVNLSPSMQAESALDWQVKTCLLSDAFNLIGITNADRQAVNMARAKVQQQQLRRAVSERARQGGGLGSLGDKVSPPPKRPSVPGPPRKSALGSSAIAAAAACPPPPLVQIDNLEMLGESALKMIARTLQEGSRCQNFIRLFPTPLAYQRYASIMAIRCPKRTNVGEKRLSSSQLLASVLFGNKSTTSTSHSRSRSLPALGGSGSRGTALSSTFPSSATRLGTPEKSGVRNLATTEPRKRTGKRLGVGKSSPDLSPKSLGGTSSVSTAQSTTQEPDSSESDSSSEEEEKDSFELAAIQRRPESPPSPLRSASVSTSDGSLGKDATIPQAPALGFPPQESLSKEAAWSLAATAMKLLGAKDGTRMVLMEYLVRVLDACGQLGAAEQARLAQSSAYARICGFRARLLRVTGRSWSRASAGSSDSEDDDGGLVDELAAACRSSLRGLERQVKDLGRRSHAPDVEHGDVGWVVTPARHLPVGLATSAAGRQAAEALQVLSSTDLERLLQAPCCSREYASLLAPCGIAADLEAAKGTLNKGRHPVGRQVADQEGQRSNDAFSAQPPPQTEPFPPSPPSPTTANFRRPRRSHTVGPHSPSLGQEAAPAQSSTRLETSSMQRDLPVHTEQPHRRTMERTRSSPVLPELGFDGAVDFRDASMRMQAGFGNGAAIRGYRSSSVANPVLRPSPVLQRKMLKPLRAKSFASAQGGIDL